MVASERAALRVLLVALRRMPPLECPYMCVASPRGDVLVEHLTRSGNADEIASRILSRLPERKGGNGRRSFSLSGDDYTFRLAWGYSGFVFLCLECGMSDQMVWQFLGRVRQRWETQSGISTLTTSTDAASLFKQTLASAASNPISFTDGTADTPDELGAVNKQLEHVRTVMSDSIEKVLERGICKQESLTPACPCHAWGTLL